MLEERRNDAFGDVSVEHETIFRTCVNELDLELDVDAYLSYDPDSEIPEIDMLIELDVHFCDCLATSSEGIHWEQSERSAIRAECVRRTEELAAVYDETWQAPGTERG